MVLIALSRAAGGPHRGFVPQAEAGKLRLIHASAVARTPRSYQRLISGPTHKRTERRSPVWGFEFTTKTATLQGARAKLFQVLYPDVLKEFLFSLFKNIVSRP
jgi:hypothetical protein